MLETVALRAGYGDLDVLHEISLTVSPGGFVSVIGPNGAGKSTLLKAIYGLAVTRGGRVLFEGRDVTARGPHELTRLGLNYVPQLDNVFPSMSVLENLEIGAVPLRTGSSERVEAVLEMFPTLHACRRRRAGTLSGGERQMLAIARALMPSPRLLLLDEPSAALAPTVVDALFERLEAVNNAGVAILMVEQNARRSLGVCDYGYVLDMGKNRYEGPGKELLHDPKVVQLYLGGQVEPE